MSEQPDPPATVADVMSSPVVTARIDDVIGPIRDKLLFENISAVPVVGSEGKLMGIVTATDLVEEFSPEEGVRNAMAPAVAEVAASTSIEDAALHMRERQVHHLVVTDDGEMVGIVSTFDLLDALIARR